MSTAGGAGPGAWKRYECMRADFGTVEPRSSPFVLLLRTRPGIVCDGTVRVLTAVLLVPTAALLAALWLFQQYYRGAPGASAVATRAVAVAPGVFFVPLLSLIGCHG
jgi:hypothetical protein